MLDNRGYIITPLQAVTLHGLFLERVKRTPEARACGQTLRQGN